MHICLFTKYIYLLIRSLTRCYIWQSYIHSFTNFQTVKIFFFSSHNPFSAMSLSKNHKYVRTQRTLYFYPSDLMMTTVHLSDLFGQSIRFRNVLTSQILVPIKVSVLGKSHSLFFNLGPNSNKLLCIFIPCTRCQYIKCTILC